MKFAETAMQNRFKQIHFGSKVVINHGNSDIRLFRDVAHRHGFEPVFGAQFLCNPQQPFC